MSTSKISVAKLSTEYDPFESDVWDTGELISKDEVITAIREKRLMSPEDAKDYSHKNSHIERIAWFVVYGWSDSIEVDFGIPGMYYPNWGITDGNHRFAAAIIRSSNWIIADWAGAEDTMQEFEYSQ